MHIQQEDDTWNKNPLYLRALGMGKKYFVKTPWWLMKLYPSRVWRMDKNEKNIYLSFDDGPHPVATPFVLDELKKYNAKASFFCTGENVAAHPHLYQRILQEGHAVGNHTQHHFNGWKTSNDLYLADVKEATGYIDTGLFRPPYGRINSFQAKNIPAALGKKEAKIIMWTVLSGDFDEAVSPERCLKNVTGHAQPGSIVVFHDSEKAFSRLHHALPHCLQFFFKKGYGFRALA